MVTYAIWNNKGGTGKTSLTFQTICRLAERGEDKKILVVDICPQANLSELLLGGLSNNGASNLLRIQGKTPRCTIGGYFDSRLPSPFSTTKINSNNFIIKPHSFNKEIPKNISLICGDPLLELQANAMNTLANANLPGVNTWLGVIDWLRDFINGVKNEYDFVFIDTNPSFSMYTQIALAASDFVMLPVMADDSSRRAIQNAFSLMFGEKLPSEIYSNYTFASKLLSAKRKLPKIHLILKNRLTQYMGSASAYAAVLSGIDSDISELITSYGDHFTFDNYKKGTVEVRDFGTTGVVAFARGCPFSTMPVGRLTISNHRVQVKDEYKRDAIKAIDKIVDKIISKQNRKANRYRPF